jgi:hypothetical protein
MYGPYSSPSDAQNVSLTAEQRLSGGNPDAHLELVMRTGTVDAGAVASWAALINTTMAWDPAMDADGPLGQVDFKLDARLGEGPGNRVLTIAVEQDGFIWVATNRRVFFDNDEWATINIDCMDQLDFFKLAYVDDPEQPSRPDFSATGSPLSFGIGKGQSCPASADCSQDIPREVDVDNFEVVARNKTPFVINAGVNDAWFNPATNGQGFYVAVYPDLEFATLAWFTYEAFVPEEGTPSVVGYPDQRWLLASGPFSGDTATMSIYRFTGGLFDQTDPLPGEGEPIGTGTMEWCDCGKGTFTYSMPKFGLSGSVPVVRIANDNQMLCEALAEPVLAN